MAMSCQVCNHHKRLEIDREIVQGKAHTKIALKYGVHHMSIRNHATNHLSRQLVQAYEKKELVEGLDLLGRIDRILERAEKIFARNYKKETYAGDEVALKALTQQRSTIELLAKIAAYLHEARVMELHKSREQYEQERQAEAKASIHEGLKNLTLDEKRLLVKLQRKMAGEDVDIITPAQRSFTPPPKPLPKTPPKNDSKADHGDENKIPGHTPGEVEPVLPSAPTRGLPGASSGLRLHRHLLGKAATNRPTKRRGPDPLHFPGDE